jgi:tRNA pseudouridine55 synthase
VILTTWKRAGDTPLQALEALRARDPSLADVPMVYAGRLDPMAEGVLLVLAGDDRHALPEHLLHDKGYRATFLFGVASDTGDGLGRLGFWDGGLPPPVTPPAPVAAMAAVAGLAGSHTLALPVWSSHRVRGKPLWWWARAGRQDEVDVPTRAMVVTHVSDVSHTQVRASHLSSEVCGRIARVRGVFRQAEAIADWERLAREERPLLAVTAHLDVRSGVYVRALANLLGERLGCGALLLALVRTRVGPYACAPGEGCVIHVG